MIIHPKDLEIEIHDDSKTLVRIMLLCSWLIIIGLVMITVTYGEPVSISQGCPPNCISNTPGIGLSNRHYVWEPKKDITARELSKVLAILMLKAGNQTELVDRLPKRLKRHFREVRQ